MATTAISPDSSPGASPYAGFWRRAGGWFLDSIILYVPLFILGAVLGTTRGHAGARVNGSARRQRSARGQRRRADVSGPGRCRS